MKKYILTALCINALQSYAQEKEFSIKASVDHKQIPQKAYLQYNHRGNTIVDSTQITAGKFTFNGKTDGYTAARLYLDYSNKGFSDRQNRQDYKIVYLETSPITLDIKTSLRSTKLNAGPVNKDNITYLKLSDSLINYSANIRKQNASESNSNPTTNKIILEAEENTQNGFKKYAKENPQSYFSLNALNYLMNKDASISVIEELFSNLSNDIKQTRAGRQLENTIKSNKVTAIGIAAPMFTQNDVNGKAVSLSDYRGKYVLIDFWASWCAPCRQENPFLVKAYDAYKNSNFEILGVSLDNEKQKEAWLKAIQDDGLLWTQVADLKGWKNEAALLYAVQSIPSSFLLDPDGKIIAKNLRGAELEQKLKEIFSK